MAGEELFSEGRKQKTILPLGFHFFAQLFTKKRRGVHKHRTLYMSTFELCFMLMFCSYISIKTKTSFAIILFRYLLTGKVVHYIYYKK